MDGKDRYIVSSTPHIRSRVTISDIMLDVIIALLPAAVMAAYHFGFASIMLMLAAVGSCVLFEMFYQKLTKQTVTVNDLSAVVTGLLLAFNLPASAPLWVPIVGGFFAIVIVKQVFGGLGQNFMNPALGARAFLLAAYPAQMTDWSVSPVIDGITSATPLAALKDGSFVPKMSDILNAVIGRMGGCIGETCAAALLAGGIYLIFRRVISWRTPVVYIGTVFLLTWVLGRNILTDGASALFTGYPFYEILAGGVMLGAFFMATDYSSSPMTPMGQIIMGLGCGLITVVIRLFGAYPEGVTYSILLMNLFVPLIDKYTQPKIYGEVRENA